MADPVLHIKDSYYFEVPRALWPQDFGSIEEVPAFLREDHPEATVEDFEQALAGKILIPQPFGRLDNLYEKKDGFCISKFMILEVVAAILLLVVFRALAKRMEGGKVPTGKFWNMLEAMLLFIRDQVARAAIGGGESHSTHETGEDYPAAIETFDPDRHSEPLATHEPEVDEAAHRERGHHEQGHTHHGPTGDTFAPLLWTAFFFILTLNLIGMLPWLGAPTAAFSVTLGLASVILVTTFGSGFKTFGIKWAWTGFVPHMDLPWYIWPLKVVIWVIEVFGSLIKHGVLAIRLLANIAAGHLVLLGILAMASVIATIGAALFSGLELFVAFLQAYIFTFLAALFIGAAVHEH